MVYTHPKSPLDEIVFILHLLENSAIESLYTLVKTVVFHGLVVFLFIRRGYSKLMSKLERMKRWIV